MKGIARNVVAIGEGQGVATGPGGERAHLEETARLVARPGRDLRTRTGLVGAQARHPAGGASEQLSERQDLADVAAGLAGGNAAVEAVDALGRDKSRQAGGIGMDRADAQAVALLRLCPDFVGFGEEAAGVDRGDVDGKPASAIRWVRT